MKFHCYLKLHQTEIDSSLPRNGCMGFDNKFLRSITIFLSFLLTLKIIISFEIPLLLLEWNVLGEGLTGACDAPLLWWMFLQLPLHANSPEIKLLETGAHFDAQIFCYGGPLTLSSSCRTEAFSLLAVKW